MRVRVRVRVRLSAAKTILSLRRRVLPAALAASVFASVTACATAHAQSGVQAARLHVRLAEIARQDIFLPLYGALGKGFFRREGLDVANKVTLGPDHTLAALLSGAADIALGGPDMAISSAITSQGERVKIIAAISRFDGSYLVAHDKIASDRFRWDSLKGKSLMGWHAGTFPAVFIESALRNLHIDPRVDIEYRPNVPYPARMRVWRQGDVDFATFYLVDAARLERDGAGYAIAPIGAAAGPSVYAVFLSTTEYVRGHPDAIQKWTNAIQAALRWTATAALEDLVVTAAPYLPDAAPVDLEVAFRRYRPLDMWRTDATVGRDEIAKVQSMMIDSGVMSPEKRVDYETVVDPRFAENSRRAAKP
jgi:NitT/TauT family transport system substrate-binding protein